MLAKLLARSIINSIMLFLSIKGKRKKAVPVGSERVEFRSRGSNILLRGWFFPSKGDHCIIMAPGGAGDRTSPRTGILEIVKRLVGEGYNVLLFDFRGHGESGGRWRAEDLGQEYKDVLGAFDYIISERGFAPDKVGILGFSLGAVASMVASAEDSRIKAVVSDSGYGQIWAVFIKEEGPRDWLKKIGPILIWSFKKLHIDPPKPIELIPDIRAKLLFIQGEEDEAVSSDESRKLHEASPGSELWIIPGVSHCQSFNARPDEYIRRVREFFRNGLAQ